MPANGIKVVRAASSGACFGVQRALDMTLEASVSGQDVCTLGPLIHNPKVVEELRSRGIRAAGSVEDVDTSAVVIRSHGVVPEVMDGLRKRGKVIVDATCPHVMRAQKAAARLAKDGYAVVVVGEAGHPEVEGISAHARAAGGECFVVETPEELPEGLEDPVGIVIQTTQPRAKLERMVSYLESRGLSPKVCDTVCSATVHRQEAASTLASEVDAMVVIGGRNSSNTTRLYEICKEACPRAYHVEGSDEIDPDWFEAGLVVGVSAGASTPESQIEEVVARLESLRF